jgi:hypothetical protein
MLFERKLGKNSSEALLSVLNCQNDKLFIWKSYRWPSWDEKAAELAVC